MMKHEIITPPNMDFPGVKAFFTTKTAVDTEKLCRAGIHSGQKVYLPIQKHTDKVLIIETDMKPEIADAVITSRKDILLGVQSADCVPIVVFDKKNMVIGAVHAGWRGTAAQILKKTILAMSEKFHSSADDVFVAIGPSIRGCCYHVGADVHKAICASAGDGDCSSEREAGFYVDLASANMLQAISLGVMRDKIWISGECTFCNPERFHSYRYHGGTAGRQGGFIGVFSC